LRERKHIISPWVSYYMNLGRHGRVGVGGWDGWVVRFQPGKAGWDTERIQWQGPLNSEDTMARALNSRDLSLR
jgi:hypothetical protein